MPSVTKFGAVGSKCAADAKFGGVMKHFDDLKLSGGADAVALARAMLYDPRWPWHAAAALGAQVAVPPPYWRSQPRELKDLFAGAAIGMR